MMKTEVAPRRGSRSASDSHAIGQVPDGWQVASLGEVSTPLRETINPGAYPDELFEYYSIPAFQQTGEPTLTPGRSILSQKLLVTDGAVLFGKLNPRVPKVWQVRSRSLHRKLASTEFLAMAASPDLLGDFLTFLCWSSHVLDVSKGLVGGSTPSRQRVDPSAFFDIRVPIPPVEGQRAIATTLSKLRQSVEVESRIVATLRELKAATMAKLFREGLRGEPLKQTEIGTIPESWEVVPLGSIARIGNGSTPKRDNPSYWMDGKIPWLTSGKVHESVIEHADEFVTD
jgi:type I restriction enzyme S subunit